MADDAGLPAIPPALREAGERVETLVGDMLGGGADPMVVASALLAGTMGILLEAIGPAGTADVLRQALGSLPPGEAGPR